jgi:hypothetical protein
MHDEQAVNGLRKIAWASVFRLMSPCPCLYVSMFPCLHLHVHDSTFRNYGTKNGTNRNSNFHLFSAIRKQRRQPSLCLLQRENKKMDICFLGRQAIIGNRRLLFRQTCLSMSLTPLDLSSSSRCPPPRARGGVTRALFSGRGGQPCSRRLALEIRSENQVYPGARHPPSPPGWRREGGREGRCTFPSFV